MALKIGTVASHADVNVETIRYYERRGLLPEPPRTASGYRQYSPETVQRLHFIKRAQDLGFSLGEIRDLFELRVHRTSANACDAVERKARAKMEQVTQKIRQLERIKSSLDRLAEACRQREPTGECPVLEALEDEAEAHV